MRFRVGFCFSEASPGFVEISELLLTPSNIADHYCPREMSTELLNHGSGFGKMLLRELPFSAVHLDSGAHHHRIGHHKGLVERLTVSNRLLRELLGDAELLQTKQRGDAIEGDLGAHLRAESFGPFTRRGISLLGFFKVTLNIQSVAAGDQPPHRGFMI